MSQCVHHHRLLRIFALDGRLAGGLSLVLLLRATTFLFGFFAITLSATARLLWLLLPVSFNGVLRLFGDLLVGDLVLVATTRRRSSCWRSSVLVGDLLSRRRSSSL